MALPARSRPDSRALPALAAGLLTTEPLLFPNVPALNDVRTMVKLLETLGINPETVLVIRNDTLVTHDERLEEPDTIEIRPVISGG